MQYFRMPIEIESPEELGYQNIRYNLAESSVAEKNLGELGLDLSQLKLEYTSHRGHQGLRELIAREGLGLTEADVLLTGGAAMALYIIHTSLLIAGDHMVVLKPNYSSNIAVPTAIGCSISPYILEFENCWDLDFIALEKLIGPQTKLLSLTYPHNPTGKILTEEMIGQLMHLADRYNLYLLIDETYRDACYPTVYRLLASYHPRFISVLSFSKGYGLPGIRIGALITKDKKLQEIFLAAKEMIQICNPPLEEAIAYAIYLKKASYLENINQSVAVNLEIFKQWLNKESRVEAVMPEGGVVCFARIKVNLNFTFFHQTLFAKFSILLGPGHWFDMPDEYIRIGFGYPSSQDLKQGLIQISACLDKCS